MSRTPLVLPFLAAGVLFAGSRPQAAQVRWRSDLQAATAEAARDGKPLLVVFR